ncbi:hypothetical protein [Acidithiobacillus ferriphilus]|uniref:hypothetical protein n=1 Tax=Acidithiobacillus ferriphilus TaxID=1689834 RepID=UPI002DBFA5F3|nr:hypothetical protein [Acidithiobacillus ferriphilus]MEB8474733.1 hypothetical protein [Acidithiobacillus ferriphilus]
MSGAGVCGEGGAAQLNNVAPCIILWPMNVQETVDSLRKVLESVIAPGVESLRLRLDALERDLQENGQSIDRLDARVDRLTGRMEEGFSRMDARIDTLSSSINARVDHLTERMEEGFSRMDTRLDALTSAILNMRQPTYPDAVLTRLEKLEREIENLRKQA